MKTLLSHFLALKNKNEYKRLTLSPGALEAWKELQTIIEYQLRPTGTLAHCQGWGGKICGFTLRIAGLLRELPATVRALWLPIEYPE
jgi:hypothetical protein